MFYFFSVGRSERDGRMDLPLGRRMNAGQSDSGISSSARNSYSLGSAEPRGMPRKEITKCKKRCQSVGQLVKQLDEKECLCVHILICNYNNCILVMTQLAWRITQHFKSIICNFTSLCEMTFVCTCANHNSDTAHYHEAVRNLHTSTSWRKTYIQSYCISLIHRDWRNIFGLEKG